MADNVVLNRDVVLDDAAGQMALWELKNKYDRGVITDILKDAGVDQSGLSRAQVFANLKNKFRVWFRENYKVGDWSNQQAYAVRDMKPEKLRELYVNGLPADDVKKQIEYNSFLPLFEPGKFTDAQGNEQTSPNWYEMNRDQLTQFAGQLGYNLNTMKDRKAFYDKVREYGTSYEKAKAVSDYTKDNTGRVLTNAILTPTAYKEQMKQALTDAPMDESKVRWLSALDGLASGGMIASGTGLSYWPAAGATALAETLRQGGSYVTGNGFDVPAIINAAVTQATIPATVKGLTSMATRGSTDESAREAFKNFRAGVMGEIDPLKLETNRIVEDLLRVRQEARNTPVKPQAYSGVFDASSSGQNERLNALTNRLRALRFGDRVRPGADEVTESFVLNRPNELHRVTLGQMIGKPENPALRNLTDEQAKKALLDALENEDTYKVYRPLTGFRMYSQDVRSGSFNAPNGPLDNWEQHVQQSKRQAIIDRLAGDKRDYEGAYNAIESNADELENALSSYFPKHFARSQGNYTPIDEGSTAYKIGSKFGPVLGGAEAASGISLQQLLTGAYNAGVLREPSGITEQKENVYTKQDWYRNLAKTRQGKALLEQLKKELEKRDAPEGEQ